MKISPPVLEKKIFKRVLTIYGRGGHLGHVTSIISSDFHFHVQVNPDITRWSGSTELMRVIGEARIKYLSSQTRPHDVSEVSLGGEMLVLGVSRQSSTKD